METKVKLTSTTSLKRFEGENEKKQKITIGNDGETVGPMQSVLLAAAGCSSIDVVMILEKMKQNLKDIEVEVTGKRAEEHPKIYTDIHLHYKFKGVIAEEKAARAIELSLTKYCSVSLMLAKAANITSSFEINSKNTIEQDSE